VLLRRAPLAVVAAFALTAIAVAFEMDYLFFANYGPAAELIARFMAG
jgi:hypothetical protein